MIALYGLSFVVAFVALALWFALKREQAEKYFSRLMFLALVLYSMSLVTVHAPMVYKFQTVFRDMLFLGVFGAIFSRMAGWQKGFWLGVVLSLVAMFWFYRQFVSTTFPYHTSIPLDAKGEILLELKEGHQVAELTKIAEKYDLKLQRAFFPKDVASTELDNYYVVDIPDAGSKKVVNILRRLSRANAVSWAEENEIIQVEPLKTGNLPAKLPSKFGINDPGVANLWGFERMQMDKLYDYLDKNQVKPVRKALIAILDTGVDGNHEDIKSNFKSIDAASDRDLKGHGTHCAGIAGAVSNNGVGVASYSRDNRFTTLTSVKVLGDQGFGTQQGIINGIIKAADAGADVISMSLGGPSNQSRQKAYDKAVNYANKKGAIVVVAAGNSNRNASDFSPVNSKGVIGVSAVDSDLNRAEFSNYVQDLPLGVAAPGVGIYSTIPNNRYETYNGTSMATPYVAGLLGLLKSIKPSLTTEEAYKILNETGMDTRNSKLTGKFIQPLEAVKRIN
ncbi:S8 family peptidase [Haliscomenobacter hydrossis]|uniref:Subtilisin n=1 Tax=Haliscomenobacter hydrossis (strain ATCC 27775 / DSM 1100 / LMG 10767 / O) TaxID=760192 RepID=F4KZ52_HALH1|nr:S8 family serine peptidase [Haliscomenobacter hydrossis]AEE53706.1 Subtilisin [Haliscomenobacter hydrossis DSM 1100]